MKNIFMFALILGTTTTGFLSCSDSVSVGGGGTGTETVNTYALRSDGTPAAGAIARIVEARWWVDSIQQGTSPVLGQAVADDNGHIAISFPECTTQVNLQIDHTEEGLLLPLTAVTRAGIDTVRLERFAAFSGSFDSSSAIPHQVLLAGTSYKASVNNERAFSFGNVAPGPYAVIGFSAVSSAGLIGSATTLSLEAGKSYSGTKLQGATGRLLVDNFECGIGPTSLGRIFPVLGWYVLSDSLYYSWNVGRAAWTKLPSTVIGHSPIRFDSAADGNGGQAFTFTTILDPVSPLANALIGMSLKPLSADGVDLSAMSAFSLRASGNGTIRVRFESRGLDSTGSQVSLSHYSYPLKLTKTMQSCRIPVDSLRILEPIANPSRFPWENESKNILRIEFEFSTSENDRGDTLTLCLDDFYLEGITINDLLQ